MALITNAVSSILLAFDFCVGPVLRLDRVIAGVILNAELLSEPRSNENNVSSDAYSEFIWTGVKISWPRPEKIYVISRDPSYPEAL